MNVLDLGAFPGSWLQYAREIVGPNAKLIGVDLNMIKPLDKNTLILQADVLDDQIENLIRKNYSGKFDVILSDLAPKTSGIHDVDHYRSMELSQRVVYLANIFLTDKGVVVLKVFQGSDFDKFIYEMKKRFKRVHPHTKDFGVRVNIFKPKAIRGGSFEVYVILREGKK